MIFDYKYIYGAQSIAYTVYRLMKNCQVKAFIVSERADNPYYIDGIPVITVDEMELTDEKILIAVPDNVQPIIAEELNKRGFCNYDYVTSEMLETLSENYFSDNEYQSVHRLKKGNKKANITIFMAKHHNDRKLKSNFVCPEWIVPIQVGADQTDIKISDIRDNIGDNISFKNCNYSELTASYWISKHGQSDYLGLYHYRRVLNVDEDDLYRIVENDIDVVLPYPILLYPNIETHHKRCIKDDDWSVALKALEDVDPRYAQALPEIYKRQSFYHFNMLIAKKEVFRNYVEWMYKVTSRIEKISNPKGCDRADRYIGYIAENLTTLYFTYHNKDLKIAHAGRYILQ